MYFVNSPKRNKTSTELSFKNPPNCLCNNSESSPSSTISPNTTTFLLSAHKSTLSIISKSNLTLSGEELKQSISIGYPAILV